MIYDLLKAMSADMGIVRFRNESEDSFTYRLCYSALGQWCLRTAQNSSGETIGTTKHHQTIVLNDLLERYTEIFPNIAERFVDSSNQQSNISVSIRRAYEETGYLLTDGNNHNRLANYGRSIRMGDKALFFGLPSESHTVNGLGVFSSPTTYMVSAKDYLIRDDLTYDEYFRSRFYPIDFYERDINIAELEFFDPLSNNVPSQSWSKKTETDCSVARKSETGPFYRVMKEDATFQFADEAVEAQSDSFISYEYRRLYFAMKAHYGNPLRAFITKFDEEYSKIVVRGHLPNREYYFLLLLSWPEHNAFDKSNFIIHNSLLPEATAMITNIGIEIKGGSVRA